jgi:hypothetical protein
MTRTTIDGYALFKAIGENPELFSDVETTVDQTAQKVLLTTVKKHSLTLERQRALHAAVGGEAYGITLDNLGASDLKKILKSIDPHFAGLAKGTPDDHRAQIEALVTGSKSISIKPEKPAKASKNKSAAKTDDQGAAWPTSMSAKPSRNTG